ncbi:HD domain-containing protein [Roseibium aggregatum]|uniref:phosphoribosyltransferase-like protein n=1 Tax=Roseibium aggregatum TaxID=187304 RepID=UPI00094AAA3C|nr:HD domain-containing protein [Roseibium aggregatum]UFI04666.1 HD domain-containing protein [Roseibium aggregatum]
MSLEKLRELQREWRKDTNFVNRLNSAFDAVGFTDAYVDAVLDREPSLARKSKQLKDNVWGMIEFDWRCMRLIDSPILQRLRRIHQLGFSFLTYPTAEHSRFSHSLGVAHVTSRFIEAIDKRAKTAFDEGISDLKYISFSQIPGVKPFHLMHAALLHDIGHLPYSHVSEKVIASKSTEFNFGSRHIGDVLFDVNSILGKNLPIAEVLSLVLVLSSRFERFYRNYVLKGISDTEDACSVLACLIAGVAPAPGVSALSDIISSASVDADKIDYVNRDALNCGIPVGVDVSRVFLRSGIVQATAAQISRLELKDTTSEEYLFVLNTSGIDTIDEVLLARTALFQRVYFHAVTRTAERIFGMALVESAQYESTDSTLFSDILTLWGHDDAGAVKALQSASSSARCVSLVNKLNLRLFPKKAYSFGPSLENLTYPFKDAVRGLHDNTWTELRRLANTTVEEYLRDERLWTGDASAIETAISSEIAILAEKLKANNNSEFVPSTTATSEEVGVLVVGTAHKDKRRHVQIMCQGEQLIAGRKYTNAPEQQDAFELLKEVGFVLSEASWRYISFFAARSILCDMSAEIQEVGVSVNSEQTSPKTVHYVTRFLPDYGTTVLRSGLPPKKIRAVERALRDTDYFDEKPWLSEPIQPDDSEIITISEKLSKFEGVHGWRITPQTTAAYFSQFPPRLRPKIIKALLDHLIVTDIETVRNTLVPLLTQIGEDCDIVGLTPTSGSATQNQLRREFVSAPGLIPHYPADLAVALDQESSRPLIFVDDNISSGTQATAQLLTLFGVPKDRWPQECRSEKNLFSEPKPEHIQRLKSRPLYLMVCVGTETAEKRLLEALRGVPDANFKGLRFAVALNRVEGMDEQLIDFLREVGTGVMAWGKFRKNGVSDLTQEEKTICEANALGYGNAGGLVTTLRSVPTGTISAIWQPGFFRGQPWFPLVVRDSKFEDLILG